MKTTGRDPEGRAAPPAAGPPPLLSVVVPAWNEAAMIEECLARIVVELAALEPEVVVVDDGSSDGTADRCAAWIRAHPRHPVSVVRAPHRGKGAAVRTGALVTRGRVVAFIDADLDVPPAEIARLYQAAADGDLDIVVGSKRVIAWHGVSRPFGRKVLSIAFAWVVRALFRLPVGDTQTGVKLFDGPWLRAAAPLATVRGFLFDVELLALAAADGLRMGELRVPVGMRRAANRIGAADVARCVAELAWIPFSVHRARSAALAARPRRAAPGRFRRERTAPSSAGG